MRRKLEMRKQARQFVYEGTAHGDVEMRGEISGNSEQRRIKVDSFSTAASIQTNGKRSSLKAGSYLNVADSIYGQNPHLLRVQRSHHNVKGPSVCEKGWSGYVGGQDRGLDADDQAPPDAVDTKREDVKHSACCSLQ